MDDQTERTRPCRKCGMTFRIADKARERRECYAGGIERCPEDGCHKLFWTGDNSARHHNVRVYMTRAEAERHGIAPKEMEKG